VEQGRVLVGESAVILSLSLYDNTSQLRSLDKYLREPEAFGPRYSRHVELFEGIMPRLFAVKSRGQ
jgi:hypothetical protein